MHDPFRFVPPSIGAFKRTARDIQRAYPFALQQSQDLLAKVYGYPDCHALVEHLKTSPKAGPFGNDLDIARRASLRMGAVRRFREVTRNARQLGRISIDDLAIVEDGDTRRAVMDQHSIVDAIVDGTYTAHPDAAVSDYLWFEEQDIPVDPLRSNKTVHEGVFRMTGLAQASIDASDWRLTILDEDNRDSVSDYVEWIGNLAEDHPTNPYLFARLIDYIGTSFYNAGTDIPKRTAAMLWPAAVQCRQAFDSVIPQGFRGKISYNLIGNGAKNREYFSLLYFGAMCAESLSRRKDALAWARRSVKLCNHDSLGAYVLLAHLQGKPDPRLKMMGIGATEANLGFPKFSRR